MGSGEERGGVGAEPCKEGPKQEARFGGCGEGRADEQAGQTGDASLPRSVSWDFELVHGGTGLKMHARFTSKNK